MSVLLHSQLLLLLVVVMPDVVVVRLQHPRWLVLVLETVVLLLLFRDARHLFLSP
jgi:hypothetical protein